MSIEEFVDMVMKTVREPGKIAAAITDLEISIDASEDYIRYFRPGYIVMEPPPLLFVIGDLHGDFDTLVEILRRENIIDCLEKGDCGVVFLGDYIDRGLYQVETVTAVYMLKTLYPGRVVLLRGNHEPPILIIPHPHDFIRVLQRRFSDKYMELYRGFFHSFQKLPLLAVIPGKILFLHGAPTLRVLRRRSFEEAFSLDTLSFSDDVMEDVLWSDPIDEAGVDAYPSPRGVGHLVGPSVTMRTLQLARVEIIVRGHEAVRYGYKFNHRKRMVTVFTSKAPSYSTEHAAYLRLDDNSLENLPGSIDTKIRLV